MDDELGILIFESSFFPTVPFSRWQLSIIWERTFLAMASQHEIPLQEGWAYATVDILRGIKWSPIYSNLQIYWLWFVFHISSFTSGISISDNVYGWIVLRFMASCLICCINYILSEICWHQARQFYLNKINK